MQRSGSPISCAFSRRRAAQKFYATPHRAGASPRRALPPRKTAPYSAFLQLNVSYVKYLRAPGPAAARPVLRGVFRGLAAEQLPGLDATGAQQVAGGDFLAVAQLCL